MRRTLILLLILFVFYLLIQMIFNYVGPGHDIDYKVSGYNVHEILTQHHKEDSDNYYFEITKDDTIFTYQIDNFRQGSKLVKKIKYFKNVNYECMIPILRVKEDYVNVVCKKDGIYYNYSDIKGNDPEVDQFASEYDNTYKNKNTVLKDNGSLFVYDNLVDDQYLVLEDYKGIYIINPSNVYRRVILFKKELYKKPIAALVGDYYIVADYDEKYDFHKFYLVDVKTGMKDTLISNSAISFNSYVEGVIDNSLYIFDKDNQKQYKIDVKDETVTEIGNAKTGIQIYQDGEFKDANVYEASEKEILFDSYTSKVVDDKTYAKVDLVGSKTAGYYYLYDLVDGEYDVYRTSVRNPKIKTYLFRTANINHIAYVGNYIYYLKGDKIYAYNNVGDHLILKYKDIMYNTDLKFYVYSD